MVARGASRPEPNAGERWVEHTVRQYEQGWTVAEVLERSLHLPRNTVRQLGKRRAIRVNRRPAGLGTRLAVGDVLLTRPEGEHDAGLDAVEIPLDIVHEDDALLVVNKPPFLLVHPTRPDQRHTLVNALVAHYRRLGSSARPHPVHRLDRDTSGLVLIARTPDAHTRLHAQIEARTLRREYLAVVAGHMNADEGVVDAPLGPHPTQGPLRAVRADGDPARTYYRVIERLRGATLVALRLETGRTHQIRVHMAHLGHPLLGDRQYGRRAVGAIGRQALHAERLSFEHPATREALTLRAPLPADLNALLIALRG